MAGITQSNQNQPRQLIPPIFKTIPLCTTMYEKNKRRVGRDTYIFLKTWKKNGGKSLGQTKTNQNKTTHTFIVIPLQYGTSSKPRYIHILENLEKKGREKI